MFLAMLGDAGVSRALAQVPDAKPTGYVNDYAGVLSPAGKQRLEALATELDQKTGAQLAIVIVNSLEGLPIEDYSIELASRWGIGSKEKGDTGIMLLLAIQDRRNRIEVGYGLEPILPDGKVGSILRDMRPLLRAGDYDGAVWQAAGQIAGIIAQANNVTLGTPLPQPARQRRSDQGSPLAGLIWLLILLALPFLMIPRRRRRGGWYGPAGGAATGFILGGLLGSMLGGGRRGGFGGGGFSSGGFGGFGGGGFGGGGASSSW